MKIGFILKNLNGNYLTIDDTTALLKRFDELSGIF